FNSSPLVGAAWGKIGWSMKSLTPTVRHASRRCNLGPITAASARAGGGGPPYAGGGAAGLRGGCLSGAREELLRSWGERNKSLSARGLLYRHPSPPTPTWR